MRFAYDLTVPADTAASSPETLDVQLVPGTLTWMGIRFYRGCHYQVYVRVRDALHVIVPVADSEPINGDGEIIPVPLEYELSGKAPIITFEGWSPGTSYDHKIRFYFDLEPKGASERQAILDLLFGGLLKRRTP